MATLLQKTANNPSRNTLIKKRINWKREMKIVSKYLQKGRSPLESKVRVYGGSIKKYFFKEGLNAHLVPF
jgi:hypothetical protein